MDSPTSIDTPDATVPPAGELTPDELLRYSRHLRLPEVGLEGQRRLAAASVLVVGAGGLGSPAALYLAAAGVGRLGLVDADRVELSNLQRQIVHDTTSVGAPKTESARQRLAQLNPHVAVEPFAVTLTAANALELIRGFDVVIDGTDNFATRYVVNDACVLLGTPYLYGSVSRFEGQASVFVAGEAPCYRCLFPEPPAPGTVQNCAEAGVLGVLPGLVGVVQAAEALKLLLGLGETLAGRLLLIDVLHMRFRTVQVSKVPSCPACGTRARPTLEDAAVRCAPAPNDVIPAGTMPNAARPTGTTPAGTGPADGTPDASAPIVRELTPRELAVRMRGGEAPVLIDVREPYEWQIARLAGATLVPLSRFAAAAAALDPAREVVLYCHHGVRSLAAAEHLAARGFSRVWSLAGGIDRWSLEIDPTIPRY